MARKLLRFCAKAVLFVVLFFYALAGIFSAAALYENARFAAMPLSALAPLIASAAEKGDTSDVAAWISAHPAAQTDAELRVLAPQSGVLAPQVFFAVFRNELKLGRIREALFWLQLGRYRMRYDLLRCGGTPEDAARLDGLLDVKTSKRVDDLMRRDPGALKDGLRRVLDFDARYPAADDPARLCKYVLSDATPVPRVQWPLYRAALRRLTEEYIGGKNKPPAKKTAPREGKTAPMPKNPAAKNVSAKNKPPARRVKQ